jgi:copper chaperone CopZ
MMSKSARVHLQIDGVSTNIGLEQVEKFMANVDGVKEACVDLARHAWVRYDPDETDVLEIEQAVEACCFAAHEVP